MHKFKRKATAKILALVSPALAIGMSDAAAEIVGQSENGFKVSHEYVVSAGPEQVWNALLNPALWWSSAHTWSGDAANLTLDPQAGGCWCEIWEDAAVQHMTVASFIPPATMVLTGGLGPLQSMGVDGALTFTVTPEGEGSRVAASYSVSGYFDPSADQMAPAVDGVIGEQMLGLAALLNDN